jgi:hypothetical protein
MIGVDLFLSVALYLTVPPSRRGAGHQAQMAIEIGDHLLHPLATAVCEGQTALRGHAIDRGVLNRTER